MKQKYRPVIGLEVHIELNTSSKMFCGCSADYFGKEPNTHVCPVCLGLPGALPVPNKAAIDACIKIGLALNCQIPNFSKFDRKNYFYPDLPKGYQISQYDQPFCINGYMILKNGKKIRIRRAHMEEDTAKLTHAKVNNENVSLIDFNRSGIPLVEVVTEPDFESAEEVVEYLKRLQLLVRYLEVSNADMEKGDMRLEPNISLRKQGRTDLPDYKVEVKNINSFRFVAKAIDFEIRRQAELLDKGERPKQETRGWNEQKNGTVSQRSKEEAHDYRYFPEPDIPPFVWDDQQTEELRKQLPELPWQKEERFVKDYDLKINDARILTEDRQVSDFLEEAIKYGQDKGVTSQQIANYIINQKIDLVDSSAAQVVDDIAAKGQGMISDEDVLEDFAKEVIKQNPKSVEDYKKGKVAAIQVLIGGVMKKTSGKADAARVKDILEDLLKN